MREAAVAAEKLAQGNIEGVFNRPTRHGFVPVGFVRGDRSLYRRAQLLTTGADMRLEQPIADRLIRR